MPAFLRYSFLVKKSPKKKKKKKAIKSTWKNIIYYHQRKMLEQFEWLISRT